MIDREKAEIDTDAALAVLGFPDIGHPSAYATIIPKVTGATEPLIAQDLPDEAFAKFGKWVRKVARREWNVPDVISEYILAQAEKAEVKAESEDSDPLAETPKRGRGRPPKAAQAAREDGQGEEKPTSSSSDAASTSPQSESGSAVGAPATVSEIVVAASEDEYDPFEDPEMADLVAEYKDATARELEAIKYLQDRGISSTYMVSVRKGPHWIDCALRHRDEKRDEKENALVAWIIVEGMAIKRGEVAG